MSVSAMPSYTQLPYSESVAALLDRAPSLFIGNEWCAPETDEVIPVIDPSSGLQVSGFADASQEDVNRAVVAARQAFDDGRWSNLPPIVREGVIFRLADLIERHADEFAELEAIDNGKPKTIAAALDIPGAIGMLRYMAGWTTKLSGESAELMSVPRGSFHSYVRREPIGVAAQIVPWNFPLLMAILKIAPALAAGCTLILKPAEQTSLTALRLADLVVEAGFPAGVINIVTGYGHTAGDFLVKHPMVDSWHSPAQPRSAS
jgi:phenylacetaldehyde dehydrogenase